MAASLNDCRNQGGFIKQEVNKIKQKSGKLMYLPTPGTGLPTACSAQTRPFMESQLNLALGVQGKKMSFLPEVLYKHPFPTILDPDPVAPGPRGAWGKYLNGDRFRTPAVPFQIVNYR